MTKAGNTGEDFIGRLGPHEGLRRFVVHGQVSVDGGLEVARAAMIPRRSCFSVSNANRRSASLIQDAPFGVKCS
jgi:hypothetical protein